MVSIRAANGDDNAELLELEKMCPQGTDLVLQFDRSPDFFCRSRVYENYKVYVAEEEGKIVGAVGATPKKFNMSGAAAKAIYIYDLRVHPSLRGRGIGSKLVQQAMAEENETDLAYGIIMRENYPSVALFKRLGFQSVHDLILLNVPLYKRQEQTRGKIREMNADDAPDVVNLINDYYRNHDFFAPLSTKDFLDKTNRLPEYGLRNIQVAEEKNRIVACVGLWDYSRILRTTVLHLTARLKMLTCVLRLANLFMDTAKLPSVGEPFKLIYVRDFAYVEQAEAASKLIEHCLSLSHHYGGSFLSFLLDPSDPATRLIAKYRPIGVSYHLYAKSSREKTTSTASMIYADAMDL